MDSWPYDDSNAGNHPVSASLHQGMVGAVTLVEKNGRFEWSFLRKREPSRTWRLGKPFKVYPETTTPLPPKSHFGPQLSAQHGANFIRTCLPEADIPAELIREQVEEEEVRLRKLQDFNPHVGNLLVSTLPEISQDNATGFIAFPMGETLSDLNISTLSISRDAGISIKPSSVVKSAFLTPIQQLVASPLDQGHTLAVRTYDSVEFFRLVKANVNSAWSAEGLRRVTLADIGGREAVDIKLRSEQAILVNDQGSIYTLRPYSSRSQLSVVSGFSDSEEESNFWRLSLDMHPSQGFLLAEKEISTFDIRVSSLPQPRFNLKARGEVLTSIEDCTGDGIVRLCSTSQIYWFDRRQMVKPLLTVRHYRQFDRYLSTQTIGPGCTLLTSRRNNMISIYDVSHEDQLLHIQNEPSGVLPYFPFTQSAGQTIVTSPFLPGGSHGILLKLSQRGGVSGYALSSEDLSEDVEVSSKLPAAVNPLEGQRWLQNSLHFEQEHTVLDMMPVYDDILRKHIDSVEQVEEEQASQVYDVVEQLPDYFQQLEAPSEQILTTYDVAFRVGNEPRDPSRSDFLTGSVLNSKRGLRAVRQRRVDPKDLSSKTKWGMDLSTTLMRLGLEDEILDFRQGEAEPFSQYDLEEDSRRPVEAKALEKRCREQLEIDLHLSRNLFSTQPFGKSTGLDHTLETMTEALSLGGAPPDVEFGFLHPHQRRREKSKGKVKDNTEGDNGTNTTDGIELGLGVKLLLKDWDVGVDPASYHYEDPYNTLNVHPIRIQPSVVTLQTTIPTPAAAPGPPQLVTQSQTQRPPAIQPTFSQASTHVPPSIVAKKPAAESQDVGRGFSQGSPMTPGSQDVLMASTQVVAGPFGGRPAKKKTEKKKRVGGF